MRKFFQRLITAEEERTDGLARASLTVEAALIMAIAFFTILMSLYLTAHLHNRAYLTCTAAEQAISGHEQEDPQLFAGGDIRITRSDNKQERTVKAAAGTVHFSGEVLWKIDEEMVYKKYRPVELIRRSRKVKDLLTG